jgi:hypothetical protein
VLPRRQKKGRLGLLGRAPAAPLAVNEQESYTDGPVISNLECWRIQAPVAALAIVANPHDSLGLVLLSLPR